MMGGLQKKTGRGCNSLSLGCQTMETNGKGKGKGECRKGERRQNENSEAEEPRKRAMMRDESGPK